MDWIQPTPYGTFSRLISSPAKSRLCDVNADLLVDFLASRRAALLATKTDRDTACVTHLNSMTSEPRRLATPVSATMIEMRKTALEATRLNRTRMRMSFQNSGTLGTRPTGL